MDDFSKAEIDAGRQLFAGDWTFLSAAPSLDSLPPMAGPEIAFAGRSGEVQLAKFPYLGNLTDAYRSLLYL